jgi:glycosyltransferase involved in cell wall biosynthesis
VTERSRLPITAIVASHNEGLILRECLDALKFCDEIIVVDLNSNDDTAKVAASFGAKVIRFDFLPKIFEHLHKEVTAKARHDWILFNDPDERVDPRLARDISEHFLGWQKDQKLAAVYVPWLFYFRGKPLKGTVWGGANEKRLLLHRKRVVYTGGVHRGTIPKQGFGSEHVPRRGQNVVHHLWMRGYRDWLEKHLRYMTLEGPNRYEKGDRVGLKGVILAAPKGLIDCYLVKKGYRDGVRGVILSLFWSWYNFRGLLALYREQKRHV